MKTAKPAPKQPLPARVIRLIAQARNLYQSDDIQIDDDAHFSPIDHGCWVSAWVFVPKGGY